MPAVPFQKIAVLGAGSWGTALSVWLAERGQRVTLWGHDPRHVARLRQTRENARYLPGVALPEGVLPVENLADAAGADLVLFVTPSHALRRVAGEFAAVAPGVSARPLLLSCTKGLELDSGRRMSEVLAECLPGSTVAALSGPSHAEEVGRDQPTALVLGAPDAATAARLQGLFNAAALRAYTSDDVTGIELGGALKNIFAIAAGVSDGLGFGDNAKAALVTRSLAELVRLGVRMGGRRETFQGLSGIGDLMVTCFSRHSRNRQLGERLARGERLAAITESMSMVAEGVPTTRSAFACARKYGTPSPVIDQVYALLYEDASPAEALQTLFLRDPRPENDAAQ